MADFGRIGGAFLEVGLVGPLSAVVPLDGALRMFSHNPNIDVDITLAPPPQVRTGFQNLMIIVPLAGNALAASPVKVRSFSSITEATAAQVAGYITSATLLAIQTAFLQANKPQQVKIGTWDRVGSDTAAETLDDIINLDNDWYGLAVYSRVDADISAMMTAVEALASGSPQINKMYIAQSDDVNLYATIASWSIYSAVKDYLGANVIYYPTDAVWNDVAYLADRLSFDPDVKSQSWSGPVVGIATFRSTLTQSQRNVAVNTNHVNMMGDFGNSTNWMDPGTNLSGRALNEKLSRDWLYTRIVEDISAEVIRHGSRGDKITMDSEGQSKIKAVILARLDLAEQAKHIVPGQREVIALEISDDDYDNRRLRFQVSAQIQGSMRLVSVDGYLDRLPVILAEV